MEAISQSVVGEDERMGTIVTRYDIDNVWGLRAITHEFQNSAFTAVLEVQPQEQALEPAPFRKQKFWPFANFTVTKLSWRQYEATYRDVAETDKHINLNPFDHPGIHIFEQLFYEAVYNALAEGGACFGVCKFSARHRL
jgi:hypothetical protein